MIAKTINVLDKSIFNRISAGEVVEKPCSVVKELVENSLDSGATSIKVAIYQGGIKKIGVFDNGCGIKGSDIRKAFMPHCTSKITSVSDLDKINTLGFRGEALASIASVSSVLMISKTEDSDVGISIEVNGGVFGESMEIATQTGTSIYVNNLFYNTPARYKFLKKPKQEEAEITTLMQRFILANPEIDFEYLVDDKLVYKTFNKDIKERICLIYGEDIKNHLLSVSSEANSVKLSGFVGDQNYTKPNRLCQTLIVNGRYVVNDCISRSVYNAFGEYLMKGQFPFFVLSIFIDPSKIDVNVHPSKREIKFEEEQVIENFVYNAVFTILHDNVSAIKEITREDEEKQEIENIATKSFYVDSNFGTSFKQQSSPEKIIELNSRGHEKAFSLEEIDMLNDVLGEDIKEVFEENHEDENKQKEKIDFKQEELALSKAHKVVGVLFNTYICVEVESELLLIDQHAAHERINYDNFCKRLSEGKMAVQTLASPFIYEASLLDIANLEGYIPVLNELGFDVTIISDKYLRINSVPLELKKINLEHFFNYVFYDIKNIINTKNQSLRYHFAEMACKASVKGGDELSSYDIDYLINELKKTGRLLVCPHGRPVIIKLKKEEIEKWFKRIV